MRALAGLHPRRRHALTARAERVLNDLLDHEATIKATSYDNDKQQGHYASQIPPGVHLDVSGGIPPVWVSPYHHFRRRLEVADQEHTFLTILRAAQKQVDDLDAPGREVTAIGGTNWEEVEVAILQEGYGAGAAVIAEKYGISIQLVEQIREENDHDPKTGEYAGENRFIVEKVLKLHFVENMPIDKIFPLVRKSRATVYRYIKDAAERGAA